MSELNHFGEQLRASPFGHRMTRELYGYPNRKPHERMRRERLGETLWADVAWAYRDELHAEHSDMYLLVQRDRALRNYDLSVQYFNTLDAEAFETAIDAVLSKGKSLKPVERLADWEGAEGVYVMVFDDYKQMYVGQSSNIRKRVRAHWTGRKSFDRLVFGDVYRSILPVDEFRAFDNTRLFAARSRNPYALEERVERAADPKYSLNRIAGGELSPFLQLLAAAHPRGRDHTAVPETSKAEHLGAAQEVRDVIADRRRDRPSALAQALAQLDMTVFLAKRDDGAARLWSRRDFINQAAVNGALNVEQFEAFLTAVGESVIWPDH